MAEKIDGAPIGFIFDGDEEGTEPKAAVRQLLLIFVSVVGGLMDSRNWRLLKELLRLMEDNISVTRELMTSIEQGANIEDVRTLLERRK